MQLLMKGMGTTGNALHIPDQAGAPLCMTNLKQRDWHIVDFSPAGHVICHRCRWLYAQAQQSTASFVLNTSAD